MLMSLAKLSNLNQSVDEYNTSEHLQFESSNFMQIKDWSVGQDNCGQTQI